MSNSTTTFPAVEVTLHGPYANVAPTTFVSYVRLTTVQGNPVVLDQYGYDLTVSPASVRPLGYDIFIAIVGGKLVTEVAS